MVKEWAMSEGLHAARHAKKTSDLDADGVTVQYSDALRQKFAGLYQAVENSRNFDGAVLIELRDLSDGHEASVKALLGTLLDIGAQASRHVHVTNDQRAAEALSNLVDELSARGASKTPFTLVSGVPRFRGDSY
jgi:hypothetical protein